MLCKKYLDVAAGVAEGNTVTKEGEKKAVNMADLVEWFCYDSVAQMAWGKTYGVSMISHHFFTCDIPAITLTDDLHLFHLLAHTGLLEKGGDHTGLLEDLGAGNILVSCLVRTLPT